MKVSGTVTPTMHSEPQEGKASWACLRWQVDLSLDNGTPFAVELGKDFFLFEANADRSLFEGVALFHGADPRASERFHLQPVSLADPFALGNNFRIHFTSGGSSLRRGSRSSPPRFSADAADPRTDFGWLPSQQTRQLKLLLDQGVHLPDASVRFRVLLILPELAVASEPGQRYRLVLHLQKAARNPNSWEVAGQEWLRGEAGELVRLLESPSTNPIVRICAAGWLAETDPESSRQTLSQVGRPLQDDLLLLTCLQLLTAKKGSGLEEHALRLLQDARVPSAIRSWSALYLGVLRYKPALSALVKAASDPVDAVASGAIHGLGASGPPATDTLLELLTAADKRPTPIGNLIAENLAFSGVRTPAQFSSLWQMVEKDNRAALHALVKSGYPETFANLQKRVRSERRSEWKAALAGACWRWEATTPFRIWWRCCVRTNLLWRMRSCSRVNWSAFCRVGIPPRRSLNCGSWPVKETSVRCKC